MNLKSPFHAVQFLQPPTTELSHFLAGDFQLTICNGVNPSYKKGILMKDLGYVKIGSTIQSGKSITGLHQFRQSATVQKMLSTVNNSGDTALQLFYSTGGAWSEITDAETAWSGFEDSLVEMEDFLGYCFFVGYDATDSVWLPLRTLTGTTLGTTMTTDMAQGKYIKRYRDRLYVANTYYSATAYPYRVYFSSAPVAGSISWTPASDFFDVDYSEGITGIEQNWDRLMIFTEMSAYMYDQDSLKKVWDIGCAGQRTIQNLDAYMIWANRDNVWASTGGRPAPIANDILELLRNSTSSNWRSSVVDREYNLYLGNTSANGLSYARCLATFSIDTGMWRWRELADTVTALAPYTSSGVSHMWIGCADGDVHEKGKWTDATKIYSDNGSAITSHFRTKAYDFGDPSIRKKVSRLLAYAAEGQNLALSYRTFDKNQEALQEFKPVGNLDRVINDFAKDIRGHFIQFEGREISALKPWSFYGFTALINADEHVD